MRSFKKVFIFGLIIISTALFSSCARVEPISPATQKKTYFVSLQWDNEDGTKGGTRPEAVHKKQ